MYLKRFINVETGEFFMSFAPWQDKTEGIGGWAHISFTQYNYIIDNLCEMKFNEKMFTKVLFKNLDKLKEYLKESRTK